MFRSEKPYSAVTVHIDRLTSEQYEVEDFSGIPDLIEAIRMQSSGPTECARAIRKKIKYGTAHQQLRSLVIMDMLLENAGDRFQRNFTDEPLLQRLRALPRLEETEEVVRRKCKELFIVWANTYMDNYPLRTTANLYKELPKTHMPYASQMPILMPYAEHIIDDSANPHYSKDGRRIRSASSAKEPSSSSARPSTHRAAPTPRPVALTSAAGTFSSSKLSKNKKTGSGKPFNLAKEKENMTNCIAQASIASTNLMNGLQLVNRETERVSENKEVVNRFGTCKTLRRQILIYIQQVESDDWIGSLVNANDELVKALTAYEIMDRGLDDSDSEDWEDSGAIKSTQKATTETAHEDLAGLNLNESPPSKPLRPGAPTAIPMPPHPKAPKDESSDDEDDFNPFGDDNVAATPFDERANMSWKEI